MTTLAERLPVKDLARKLLEMPLTAEVWLYSDSDEPDYTDSKIVDVVEIDGRLHFVVVAE